MVLGFLAACYLVPLVAMLILAVRASRRPLSEQDLRLAALDDELTAQEQLRVQRTVEAEARPRHTAGGWML